MAIKLKRFSPFNGVLSEDCLIGIVREEENPDGTRYDNTVDDVVVERKFPKGSTESQIWNWATSECSRRRINDFSYYRITESGELKRLPFK